MERVGKGKSFAAASREHSVDDSFQVTLDAELRSVQESVDEIARKIIAGLDAVLEIDSPYPPAYQEALYHAMRHAVGCGFQQLLSEEAVSDPLERLRRHRTL